MAFHALTRRIKAAVKKVVLSLVESDRSLSSTSEDDTPVPSRVITLKPTLQTEEQKAMRNDRPAGLLSRRLKKKARKAFVCGTRRSSLPKTSEQQINSSSEGRYSDQTTSVASDTLTSTHAEEGVEQTNPQGATSETTRHTNSVVNEELDNPYQPGQLDDHVQSTVDSLANGRRLTVYRTGRASRLARHYDTSTRPATGPCRQRHSPDSPSVSREPSAYISLSDFHELYAQVEDTTADCEVALVLRVNSRPRRARRTTPQAAELPRQPRRGSTQQTRAAPETDRRRGVRFHMVTPPNPGFIVDLEDAAGEQSALPYQHGPRQDGRTPRRRTRFASADEATDRFYGFPHQPAPETAGRPHRTGLPRTVQTGFSKGELELKAQLDDAEAALILKEQSHATEIANLEDDHVAATGSLQEKLVLAKKVVGNNVKKLHVKTQLLKSTAAALKKLEQEYADLLDLKIETETELVEKCNTLMNENEDLFARANCLEDKCDRLEQKAARSERSLDGKLQKYHDEGLSNQLRTTRVQLQEAMDIGMELRKKLDCVEKEVDTLKRANNAGAARVEELELHVQALTRDLTSKPMQGPEECWTWCILKPDQLLDAQQALMVSQQMHGKANELNVKLETEALHNVRELRQAYDTVDNQQDEIDAMHQLFSVAGEKNRVYVKTVELLMKPKGDTAADAELAKDLERIMEVDNAMSQTLYEKSLEVSRLQSELRFQKRAHEFKTADLTAEINELRPKFAFAEKEIMNLQGDVNDLENDLGRLRAERDSSNAAALSLQKQCLCQLYGTHWQVLLGEKDQAIESLEKVQKSYAAMLDQQEAKLQQMEMSASLAVCGVREELDEATAVRIERDVLSAQLRALERRYGADLKRDPLSVDITHVEARLKQEQEKHIMLDSSTYRTTETSPERYARRYAASDSDYEKMFAAIKAEQHKRIAVEPIVDDSDGRAWIYDQAGSGNGLF